MTTTGLGAKRRDDSPASQAGDQSIRLFVMAVSRMLLEEAAATEEEEEPQTRSILFHSVGDRSSSLANTTSSLPPPSFLWIVQLRKRPRMWFISEVKSLQIAVVFFPFK